MHVALQLDNVVYKFNFQQQSSHLCYLHLINSFQIHLYPLPLSSPISMNQQRAPWFAFLSNCSCFIILLIGQFDELVGWKRTTAVSGFEVLPFVHIDYGHYLRLAECHAKCSHKYGLMTDRVLLDGSTRPYCNTSAELHEICETGCLIHLKSLTFSFSKRGEDNGSVLEAFENGQSFWKSSSGATNIKHSQKQAQQPRISSPIEKIRVLCLEHSSTSNMVISGGLKLGSGKRRSLMAANKAVSSARLFDSFEAILTADLKDEFKHNKSFSQHKYIVQWRQKQADSEESKEEETKWITASIEPSNTFKVIGLQPGFVYRFMLTIVTPSGKMVGENSKSDWINFAKLAEGTYKVGAEKAALSFHSEYNLENNVGAVVRWVHFKDIFKTILPPNHPQLAPTASNAQLAEEAGHTPLLFEGCRMQIEYANKTTKIAEDFVVDESDGFLLKNLGFSSEYSVEIRPRQSLLAEQRNYYHNQVLENTKSSHLAGKFLSMSCAQVYGAGSLECEPEPVYNIEVESHPENGTVTVLWTPPAEMHHILLYQLYYLPASESVDCALEPTSLFLTANSTSASLQMPTLSECEFEIKLVNYDLLGREATASKNFVFSPADDGISAIDLSRKTTCLIIGLFAVMVLALLVVIKFAAFWPARLKVVMVSSKAASMSSSSASINSSACSSKRPSLMQDV